MFEDEYWATATLGFVASGSIPYIGDLFGSEVSGVTLTFEAYIAEGVDPNDGSMAAVFESYIPDESGVMVSVSATEGFSVGGRLVVAGTAFPSLGPGEVVENIAVDVSVAFPGAGFGVSLDQSQEIAGYTLFVGPGAGIDFGVGETFAVGMNNELGLVLHTENGSYQVDLFNGTTTPFDNTTLSQTATNDNGDDGVNYYEPYSTTVTSPETITTVTSSGTTATSTSTGATTTSGATNVALPSGGAVVNGNYYAADDPVFDLEGPEATLDAPPSTPRDPVINDLGTYGPRPIIMDLDGDGVEVSFGNGPRFDWDSDGFLEQGSWASADDGFLVIDLDEDGNRSSAGGDGVIDNADEVVWTNLLESSDFNDYDNYMNAVSDVFGLTRQTDLEALNLLERRDDWGNGDGVLDENDAVWSELRIWQDINQNGVTDEGELLTLNELGITEIALRYDDGTAFDDYSNDISVLGNNLSGLGSFTRNGDVIEGGVGDLGLNVEQDGIRATDGSDGITYTFEDGSDAEFLAVLSSSDPDFAFSSDGRDDLIGVRGSASSNTIDLRGATRGQIIEAGVGADTVSGSHNSDLISGGDGADTIRGWNGNDAVDGGNGRDVVYGGNGNDQLTGGAYHDHVNGGNGDDLVFGDAGDDTVVGGNGVDDLYGGDGDDRLYGGDGMGFGGMHVASNNFTGDGNWDNDRHERTLADVNNDGRADIVAFGNSAVYVQFGQTDGTFSSSVVGTQQFTGADGTWSSTQYGYVRTAADVDGDGNADLVAFGYDDTFVALGNGDGTFDQGHVGSQHFAYRDGWDDDVHERILADVNGDGRADIVAFGNSEVYVQLGQANGTFSSSVGGTHLYTTENGGWRADRHERTAADVNGDGYADLVAFGSGSTYVALGNGDGTFGPSRTAHTGFAVADGWDVDVHERRLEDVNGDGRADIVGFGNNDVFIALGQENGTFGASTTATELFTTNNGNWRSDDDVRDANDIDGNGYADLVGFGDAGVYVALNRGDILNGGQGDDILVGGGGSDIFVFAEGDGYDRIADFDIAFDKIQFTSPDIDLENITITQSSNASVITYGDGGDAIRLNGVSVDQLTENSFIFA